MLPYMFIALTGPDIVQYRCLVIPPIYHIVLYYYYCTITFSAKLSQHCLPCIDSVSEILQPQAVKGRWLLCRIMQPVLWKIHPNPPSSPSR